MNFYDEIAALLGIKGHDSAAFADFLGALATAQGDQIQVSTEGSTEIGAGAEGVEIQQTGWRLMRGLPDLSPEIFTAWLALWEGALSVHNRHLRLTATWNPGENGGNILFRITKGN